jgi:hypothetical protein
MGLLVSVFRNAEFGDCTCNGVSKRFNSLCVINVEGPFEPDENHPAVILESGPYNSVRLVPVCEKEAGSWTMMGGNYAGTSDGRFSDAVRHRTGAPASVVAVHDRVER